MLADFNEEYGSNLAYLTQANIQNRFGQRATSVAATLLSSFNIVLFWLRGAQIDLSWKLYKLYNVLNPPTEQLPDPSAADTSPWSVEWVARFILNGILQLIKIISSIIPFALLAVLNGASFAIQFERSKGNGFYMIMAGLVFLVLFPFWLSIGSLFPLIDAALNAIQSELIAGILGVLMGFAFLAMLAAPFYAVYLKVVGVAEKNQKFSYAAQIVLGATALYFAATVSFLWAAVAAWYIVEPLFLSKKAFDPSPSTFMDDHLFNERAIVEVFFDKKMFQLEKYWGTDKMPSIIDGLFERFFNQETNPAIRIRFMHHFLRTVKAQHRALTPAEKDCILRHLQAADASAYKEMRTHADRPSRIDCSVSDTQHYGRTTVTRTWSKSAQHTNPYRTLLNEAKALFAEDQAVQSDDATVLPEPFSPLNSSRRVRNDFDARMQNQAPMTDGLREQLYAEVNADRRNYRGY